MSTLHEINTNIAGTPAAASSSGTETLGSENRVSLGDAIAGAYWGIGEFISSLFHLNPKSAAVLSGGIVLGVLAGLPIVGWLGILWAVLVGSFTVFLYIRRSPQPAVYVDGVVLGAIAGTIGSFIQLLFSLILSVLYLVYAAASNAARQRQPDPWGFPNQGYDTALSALGAWGTVAFSLALFIPLILLAILGGLVGVVWFESRVSESSRVSR